MILRQLFNHHYRECVKGNLRCSSFCLACNWLFQVVRRCFLFIFLFCFGTRPLVDGVANGILFETAAFEARHLSGRRSSFVCFPAYTCEMVPEDFPPISQGVAARNRFTFPLLRRLSRARFQPVPPPRLSSLTIWLFCLISRLNWADR